MLTLIASVAFTVMLHQPVALPSPCPAAQAATPVVVAAVHEAMHK